MIEVHSHILPGIDDGAKNLNESIEMAKQAYMDGVTDIIATPHYIKGSYDNNADIVTTKVEELNAVLQQNNIKVNIYPGAELYYDIELLDDIINKKVNSLNNGMYVLIELPMQSIPHGIDDTIFKLLLKGYAPVIAHPERNSEILQSPGKLYKLIEKGVLVQMNAGSLLGDFGSKVQEIAKLFLQNKFVNFVGSDTHHYKKRNSKLSLWVEEASKYINVEYACDMVTTFPKSILESKERLFEEPEMFENYEEIKPKNALKRILDRLLG